MELGRGPLLLLLLLVPLFLLPDASQAAMNEVPILKSESYPDSALESGENNQFQTYNRPQRWISQAEYQPVQQPHQQEQYMQIPNTEQVFQEDVVQQQRHAMEPPTVAYPYQDIMYQNQYIDSTGFPQSMNTHKVLQPGQYAENSFPNYRINEENALEQGQLIQHLTEVEQEKQQYQNQVQQQNDPMLITGYNNHDMASTKWKRVNEKIPIVQATKSIQQLQKQKSNDQQLETKQTVENTDGHSKDLQKLMEDNAIHLLQLNPEKGKTIIHSDILRNAKLLWKGQTTVDEGNPPQQEANYKTQLEEIQLLQQQLLQQQKYLMQVLERESNSNIDKNYDTFLQKSPGLNDNSNVMYEYSMLDTQSSPRESRNLQDNMKNPKSVIQKMPRYLFEVNPKQVYENLNQGQMNYKFNQKSSLPEYPFDDQIKRLNEPKMNNGQNQGIIDHSEFTNENNKNTKYNGIGYDYSYDEITAFNYNEDLHDDGLTDFVQGVKWEEVIPKPKTNENDFPYIDNKNWDYVSDQMIDHLNNANKAHQYEPVEYNDYVSNVDEYVNLDSSGTSLLYNPFSDADIYSTIDEMKINSASKPRFKNTHSKHSISNGNIYNAPTFTYKIPQEEMFGKSFSYKYPKSSTPVNHESDFSNKFQKNAMEQKSGIDASYIISNNLQEKSDKELENNHYYYLFDKPSNNRKSINKNNMKISSQSQNYGSHLHQPTNVNSGDFNYKHRRGRKNYLNNLKDGHFEMNNEADNVNEKENSHHASAINEISLDGYSNIKDSSECDENCKMEIIRKSNKSNEIKNEDQSRTKISEYNTKDSKSENLEKCDPWNPHTKTETVTSNMNTDEGTLKTIISKKSCNKPMTNESKTNTPCLITVTTETTAINEYCLLPKYQDKDNGTAPCYKNTTTTHSVTTEPCDKTADIQKASNNITSQSVLSNKSKEISPTRPNAFKENIDENVTTEIMPKNSYSSSSTIPPKLEVTSTMNNNILVTDNKIYNGKSNNISDCVDYKQYLKYSTSSNACVIKSSGVSEEDINIILELHNLLRSKIARGEEQRGRPGPQPPAANMKELRWNNDLARAAQAWAQQCPQESAPHKYRTICSRTYDIGQNVAYFNAKKDDKTQKKGKYNDQTGNEKRKKRFVEQINDIADSLTEKDVSDAIVEDENYLEDDIIGDDKSEEDAVIKDYSNEDETFINDDFSKDEALIAMDTIADQLNEGDNSEEALISNEINKSEEIILDEVKLIGDFAISDEKLIGYSDYDLSDPYKKISDEKLQDIEKDFTLKSHSLETDLKNLIIFNSLNKAHNKEKGWKNVILEWYKGVERFPNYMVSSIKDLNKSDKEGIEEYFQVVWADTEEIGCTVIHYTDNQEVMTNKEDYKEERISSIYVCNYGPAASRDKSSLYVVGDAVSQCPEGVSATYPDLCRFNSSIL